MPGTTGMGVALNTGATNVREFIEWVKKNPGKGSFGSLGVLRQATPRWLADPALRPMVLAIQPAQPMASMTANRCGK